MYSVVGHRTALNQIQRAVRTEQLSHAYLFTGPDAIGKRTFALELARMLLCQQPAPDTGEPCGSCSACTRLAHGNHPDLMVVEPAAGKRTLGIDVVREAQRAANLAPVTGSWRVFVLPEVERMTPEAVNALLKTLEEPPASVVLALTSNEPEQLLPTLLSRCQTLPLHPLTIEEVAQTLRDRAGLPPNRAQEIAALANGRLGWALQAAADPAMEQQRASELHDIARLTAATRDERLRQAGIFASDGEHARRVLDLWLLWWRDVVLAAHGAQHLATTDDARAQAVRQGQALGIEKAEAFLRALLTAQVALEQNANARLTLEVLVLDLPTLKPQR